VTVRSPCVVLEVLNKMALTMSSTVLAVNAPPPFLVIKKDLELAS
jgi:hypothetical protein